MRTKPKKVMVIGACGLLGTPTAAVFGRDPAIDVEAVDLPEMDITSAELVRASFDAFRPDLVVNCAAYTAVDDCEENEQLACSVNGTGAGIVASAAEAGGARMIHISTDYVFEGNASEPYSEDHPTAPPARLSAYGRSKLLGEQQVRKNHPAALIVRTAWLYGPDGPGFPAAILRRARDGGELRVVNDQTGSPTYAPDLAAALYKLGHHDVSGIIHVTNSGRCTWYSFALEILRLAGLDVPVRSVSTAEFPRPAKRPAFSVLDTRRYAQLVGQPLRTWHDAVAAYIADHTSATKR